MAVKVRVSLLQQAHRYSFKTSIYCNFALLQLFSELLALRANCKIKTVGQTIPASIHVLRYHTYTTQGKGLPYVI